MNAIRLGRPAGLTSITLAAINAPGKPKHDEISVQIQASSLNYHDYAVATGQIPTEDGRILLSDGAGVVTDVGSEISEFKIGDHVVSTFFPTWIDGPATISDFSTTPGDGRDGFARDMVTMPAAAFTKAPKGYSHVEAATLTTAALTAWRALVVNGALKAGDSVLVMGTGGVSIFALQFAKAMGAKVISTSSSDEKLKRTLSLGADATVNYRTTASWGRAVLDLTDGRGVDHVVEVGGPGTLPQSIEACRIGGHIALIGILTGWEGTVPTASFMLKQQTLRGIVVGSRRHQIDMIRGIESARIQPIVDKVFALQDLADAFRYEERGSHFGKIGISI